MTSTNVLTPDAVTSHMVGYNIPNEDLAEAPCGDEIPASAYDAHLDGCEWCREALLNAEAAEAAWDRWVHACRR